MTTAELDELECVWGPAGGPDAPTIRRLVAALREARAEVEERDVLLMDTWLQFSCENEKRGTRHDGGLSVLTEIAEALDLDPYTGRALGREG